MSDPSGRRPRYHPAVSDVLSTLADASATLADVQRRLDLEFSASYPDHVSALVPVLLPSLPPPTLRGDGICGGGCRRTRRSWWRG